MPTINENPTDSNTGDPLQLDPAARYTYVDGFIADAGILLALEREALAVIASPTTTARFAALLRVFLGIIQSARERARA